MKLIDHNPFRAIDTKIKRGLKNTFKEKLIRKHTLLFCEYIIQKIIQFNVILAMEINNFRNTGHNIF